MRASFPSPDVTNTDLHRQWFAGRAARQPVSLDEQWRGCLGLGVLLDRPDDTVYHGDAALVRNDQLTWVAMRDIPIDRFPGSPAMNRREVHYATTAVATLRHGMPALDFAAGARDAVDFRFLPYPPHERRFGRRPWDVERVRPGGDTLDSAAESRLFAALNRVSTAMTRFAFAATRPDGSPVRRSWAAQRPIDVAPFHPSAPEVWMPRAYVAVPLSEQDRLYDLSIGAVGAHPGGRWFSPAFREQFLAALLAGLRAAAVGPEVYCGPLGRHGGRDPSGDGLVRHRLRSRIDGTDRVVCLPATARLTVRTGQVMKAGELWADVQPPALAAARRQRFDARWAALPDACGGPRMIDALRRLWFDGRLVRVAADSKHVLVPAELAGLLVRALPPTGLWWDTVPAMPHYEWETQTAAFPPVRIGRWDALRLSLPGEVDVDATVADPRLRAAGRGRRRRRGVAAAVTSHLSAVRLPARPTHAARLAG